MEFKVPFEEAASVSQKLNLQLMGCIIKISDVGKLHPMTFMDSKYNFRPFVSLFSPLSSTVFLPAAFSLTTTRDAIAIFYLVPI